MSEWRSLGLLQLCPRQHLPLRLAPERKASRPATPNSTLLLLTHGDLNEQNPECSGNSHSLFPSDKDIFVIPGCEIHLRNGAGSRGSLQGWGGDLGERHLRAPWKDSLLPHNHVASCGSEFSWISSVLWNENYVEPHSSSVTTSINIAIICLSHTEKVIIPGAGVVVWKWTVPWFLSRVLMLLSFGKNSLAMFSYLFIYFPSNFIEIQFNEIGGKIN